MKQSWVIANIGEYDLQVQDEIQCSKKQTDEDPFQERRKLVNSGWARSEINGILPKLVGQGMKFSTLQIYTAGLQLFYD